jgi:cell division septation protein DedD
MPGWEHSHWYPPALIIGTALAMFLLGSVTAMWFLATPLPTLVGPTASAQGATASGREQQMTSLVGSPASPAAGSTGQRTTSGSPRPAATVSSSPAAAAPAAAASPAPSADSPASAPGSAAPAASQNGNFSLQLGAFLDEAKAKSLADQLTARGYAPVSVDAADGYGRTWHYVRLGAFADERAAALGASDLLEQAGIGAAIVRVSAANAGG